MYVQPSGSNAPDTVRAKGSPTSALNPADLGLAPLRPRGDRWALVPLAGVAAAYTLAQLLLVTPGSGLGWDESVYVSQVAGEPPAAYFSAPRARGVSYLVAPVAVFTTSTTVLRVFLALLSGLGLLAALYLWRRVLPVPILTWAGALFAGLWVTLYYGPEAMPNLWCALAALGAVGCFLRAVREPTDRVALWGLGVCAAVEALMRPPDAVWLVLPLVGAALAVPGWRRPRVVGALVAGAAAGAVPWVVEAYTSYGGLVARLRRGSEIQGGMGLNWAVDDHVRSLQGVTLCRPCETAWDYPFTAFWWFALPLLAVGGIVLAGRARRRASIALPVLVAGVMAVPYLFLMGYAAPRFLLPSYALLALAAAECVRRGFQRSPLVRTRHRHRPLGQRRFADVLVVLLAAHMVVQFAVLSQVVERGHRTKVQMTATAAHLHRLGVRPPCVLTGSHAVPLAWYAGCASKQARGHDASVSERGLRALARRRPTAVVVHGTKPPAWARSWRRTVLPFHGYHAYVNTHGHGGRSAAARG